MNKLLINIIGSFLLILSTKVIASCSENIEQSTPNSRFSLHDNATLTDNKTSLIWMRCSIGQSWDGSECIGSLDAFNWQGAINRAASTNFANYDDWRLPNIQELASIIEVACSNPSINESVFSNIGFTSYWSSSSFAGFSSYAWYINFYNDAQSRAQSKSSGYYVRLVRGGQ